MKGLAFVFVGKPRDPSLGTLENDYLKKISRFLPAEIILTKDASGEIPKKLEKETKLILEKLNPGDMVILCDERGKKSKSVELAQNLEKWRQKGKRVVFVVGGAYGFDQKLIPPGMEKLSLSTLTFPHELARVVLLEQVYRALTIQAKTGYHHE